MKSSTSSSTSSSSLSSFVSRKWKWLALLLVAATAFIWLSPPSHRHISSSSCGGGSSTSSNPKCKTRNGSLQQQASSSSQNDQQPWLVNVLLGDPHFQHYVMYSLRQARLHNPTLKMVIVVSPMFYETRLEWLSELEALKVNIVNYTMLQSDFTQMMQRSYTNLWATLRSKVGFMLPTINDKMNVEFTQLTMERLYALHGLMYVYGLKNVLHVENDQMIYAKIQDVTNAAQKCGVSLAMTRIGKRMAPAVVYAANSSSLFDMLQFMLDAMNGGPDHAIQVAGTGWVTDMSLTAAYFDKARKQYQEANGGKNPETTTHSNPITSFPGRPDDSCLFAELGLVFDAAPLGHWCCGTFERPKEYFTHRDAESEIAYWDKPFEWKNITSSAIAAVEAVAEAGTVSGKTIATSSSSGKEDSTSSSNSNSDSGPLIRVPTWDGKRIFNLHIHSKQLQHWES